MTDWASLARLYHRVVRSLNGELLWPLSMPARLPAEADIPVARFSDTPEGRRNEVYRNGLALRYGKRMQMISGVHHNFSLDETFWDALHAEAGTGKTRRDFIDDSYFALARNFLRRPTTPISESA